MFQTKIDIPVSNFEITYEDGIMGLGSCFAENMGNKMKRVYFKTEINPFGVLYNPVSIRNSIELIMNNNLFTKNDVFEYNHLWQSFSHSSLFTEVSEDGCLNKINSGLNSAFEFLKQAHVLLITFGTAWVFEERKSGRVVSNCHKLPANEFVRRRLTVDEIVNCYTEIIIKLQQISPDLNIIFSVSPIRHWKDGAHENNISKGILLLAIDEIQKQFEKAHYFPAYEILMDELRDYRFYASDMLHPSEVAVDYIWNRFSDTYFSRQTIELKKRIEQLVSNYDHRPIHPDSLEYKNFMIKAEERKDAIKTEYPFLTDRIK